MLTARDDPSARATEPDRPLRLAIAEDSLLVREGLVRILRDAGFEVVGDVATVDELLDAGRADEQPDAALIDIRLPPTHSDEGLRAATEIRDACRRWLCSSSRSTSRRSTRCACSRETSGASATCSRTASSRSGQLTEAITRVVAGGVVVDPELVAQLLERRRRADPLDELTSREREVLSLMAEGLTDRGIAQRLYVTPKTVETHTRHIFQKLSLPESALDNKRVHAVLTYLRA